MGYTVIGLYEFYSGAAMFGAWACGAYFLKFWSKTGDRLFLLFALAFWIMAVERFILILTDPSGESGAVSYVYLIRLCAFLTILFAIIDKNRKEKNES